MKTALALFAAIALSPAVLSAQAPEVSGIEGLKNLDTQVLSRPFAYNPNLRPGWYHLEIDLTPDGKNKITFYTPATVDGKNLLDNLGRYGIVWFYTHPKDSPTL
jgi:hypothetical protein